MKFNFTIVLFALVVLVACGDREANPNSYEVWGIDVSKHQKSVDWDHLNANNKPHFVFVKATEGTLIVDPTYQAHTKKLDELGILWGAYHFFGHRTSGKEQALNFIKTANLKKGNLIPVLDIEMHRFMKDPKRSVVQAKAFCKEIKRYYGVQPIIYCSTNFYLSYLKNDFSPDKYPLWIADYRGFPEQIKGWYFWQHTETHSIDGISTRVDRNVFTGSVKDLYKFVL